MTVEETTVSEPERKSKPRLRVRIECALFALAVVGGDGARVTAYNRLRGMSGKQRLRLRQSIQRLDDLLDQVTLDLHLERSKSRANGRREKSS